MRDSSLQGFLMEGEQPPSKTSGTIEILFRCYMETGRLMNSGKRPVRKGSAMRNDSSEGVLAAGSQPTANTTGP